MYVPPGPKWYCLVMNLLNFAGVLCSTLLILSMTSDRLYSIVMPHKAASFNTVERAKVIVVIITTFSILYNLPHLYLTSHVGWECIPYGNAHKYPLAELYYWLSLVVQFVLPFISLLTMNSIIIHKLRNRFKKKSLRDSNQGENSSNKNSELQVFIMLLLVTFAFLVLSSPGYIFFLFVMIVDFSKTPSLFATYYLFYHVAHKMHISNHGINFFLYVISGKKFRTDLRNIFPNLKKRKRCKELTTTNINKVFTVPQKTQ